MSSISGVIPLFKANQDLFAKALEGVSPEHMRSRPTDHSSPMIWIAGHIVRSRGGLLRMTGTQFEEPAWSAMFQRGSKVEDIVAYPAIEEISEQWDAITKTFMNRLAEITEEELEIAPSFKVPTGDQTVRGAVFFLNFHETYHVGQLAFIRKMLGYSQLIG